MSANVERARVPSDGDIPQASNVLTFDFIQAHAPQRFCQQIGLNWMSALDLCDQGRLSFDPRTVTSLSRSQEAELRFLGKLVSAGCCGSLLGLLLTSLKKPYAYNLDRLYYDWSGRHWRLLEDTEEIEDKFEEWLNELVAFGDFRVLDAVYRRVDEALKAYRARQQYSESGEKGQYIVRGLGDGL